MGRALAAFAAGIGVFFAVAVFWELKKNLAFWVVAVLAVAIQVPLILFIPWPNISHPKGMLALICFPDFLIASGLFMLVKRYSTRGDQSKKAGTSVDV